jgi:hypothetical protein
VFYKFEEADALLQLLAEHVCNHVVKVRRRARPAPSASGPHGGRCRIARPADAL